MDRRCQASDSQTCKSESVRTKLITNQQFLNWIRLIQVGNILFCRFETLLFSFEIEPEFIYLSQCLC